MEISYLGGILQRGPVERRPAVGAGVLDEDWGWMGEDAELFLHATGPCCRLFTWDALARGRHLIRVRASDSNGQVQPETSPWNRSGYLWNGIDTVECEVV